MIGFNFTQVVKSLLIINVSVYILELVLSIKLSGFLGLWSYSSPNFMIHQTITYMFVHADFWHLFSNMIGLIVFGPMLEQVFGQKRFLLFYMIAGVGAGLIYNIVYYFQLYGLDSAVEAYIANPNPDQLVQFFAEYVSNISPSEYQFVNTSFPENSSNPFFINKSIELVESVRSKVATGVPMIGASGAVFAIITAFGLLFPNLQLMLLFPPIPIKAKYIVIFYGAYSIYSLIQDRAGDNVAHLAHIGGMIFGFLLVKFWKPK